MADEKKFNSDPTFIMGSKESSEKSRSYKKCAIIAGSVVLIIAIILTAILIGVYFFSETQQTLHQLTFSYGEGGNLKEDVISDPVANIVQYHTSSDNYEAWVFNDFNRDIQVMKIQSSTETNCFVTSLNRKIAMDPSMIAAMGGENSLRTNKTYQLSYRSASNPIRDSSFLSKPAKDGCQRISTYWLFPDCQESKEVSKRQQRRSLKKGIQYFKQKLEPVKQKVVKYAQKTIETSKQILTSVTIDVSITIKFGKK